MRPPRSLAVALAACTVAACGPAEDAADAPPAALGDEVASIHAIELARHRDDPPPPPRTPPDGAVLRDAKTKTVDRVVYGYYPYWSHDLAALRWRALTHLAWFAVELDATGVATAKHGWPDTETVDAAHLAGTRVDLAFTLFSGSGVLALCSDPARRATAVDTMIDLLEQGGADGISVDFEGLKAGTRDPFTTFIAELRAGLDARGHKDAEISIAGPTVDWSDSFDVPALWPNIDHLFMMGYDIFWSGSSHAGPSGLLRTTETWRPYSGESALRGLAWYAGQIPADGRKKLVYGVPYYGREWATVSDEVAAATTDSIQAITYADAKAITGGGVPRRWLEDVATPWFARQKNGGWREAYYDDEESLAVKYDLANDQDCGGVGMWALNMDVGHDALWDLLEAKMGAPAPTPPGHRLAPLPIDAVPFHDARDTKDGPARYFDYYACKATAPEYGREWVYAIDVCQPGTLTAHVDAGAEGVDPDLHLLSAPTQEACLARDDADLAEHVAPGRYYVVVDTYVADRVEAEGPYALDVDFAPDPGSAPCAAHLACRAGACVCADAAKTDCAGACVDLATDPSSCGACGHACAPGQTCQAGACAGGAPDAGAPGDAGAGGSPSGGGGAAAGGGEVGGGAPVAAAPGATPPADEGCGCAVPGAAGDARGALGAIALAAAIAAQRGRRRTRIGTPPFGRSVAKPSGSTGARHAGSKSAR